MSVLLPHRVVEGPLRRLLHDRTVDRIAVVVSQLPNVAATVIPFQLGKGRFHLPRQGQDVVDALAGDGSRRPSDRGETGPEPLDDPLFPQGRPPGTVPIGSLRYRQRARVAGRVRSVRIQPGAGISSLECTLADETGQIVVVFQGRRLVPGIEPGARLLTEGMVGERRRRTAMINPHYTILVSADPEGLST